MVDELGNTLGATASSEEDDRGSEPVPFLFRVLEANRPTAAAGRHRLDRMSVVDIGRGDPSAVRSDATLSLRVPDRWMSSGHARLEHGLGRWLLRDLGSKNGTFVSGRRIERHELHDGDVIEIGRTFFLFRHQASDAGDAIRGDDRSDDPAFQTLSPRFESELDKLARLASTTVSLLILGESGSGKEVLARSLHARSGRRGDLVGVNCAAIPASLIESELFGHKKGAFSGAISDHPGLVRSADGGTLFLDEIGDLPPAAQAALLRVLQEREVRPVGSTRATPVDLRLICATHRQLDEQIDRGEFRADLFARIAGYRFTLPPLRDRREDLGLLVAALLRKIAPGRSDLRFEAAAARALLEHEWPLNIRELENCLATAVVLAGPDPVGLEHLGDLRGAPHAARDIDSDDDERQHRRELEELLREHAGNVSAVARAVGKDRKQVQRWLKRYGLDAARYREA